MKFKNPAKVRSIPGPALFFSFAIAVAIVIGPTSLIAQSTADTVRATFGDLNRLSAQFQNLPTAAHLNLTNLVPQILSQSERAQAIRPGILRSGTLSLNVQGITAFLKESGMRLSAESGEIVGQPMAYPLSLFDDVNVFIVQTNKYVDNLGNTISSGLITSSGGGRAQFVINNYNMTADISVGGRKFHISPISNGLHKIVEYDGTEIPLSENDGIRLEEDSNDPAIRERNLYPGIIEDEDSLEPQRNNPPAPKIIKESALSVPAAEGDDPVTITILGIYTPAIKVLNPNIENDFVLAAAGMNTDFENSNVNVRVSLVGTRQVEYVEDKPKGSSKIQDDFSDRIGDFGRTASEQSLLGADLSVLVADCTDVGGLGTLNSINANASDADLKNKANRTASLVCSGWNGSVSAVVFAHELGHNMGAAHDRYVVSGAKEGPEAYNFGYINLPSKFRTIMAYANQCTDTSTTCPRIPYFSNPNVNYEGEPVGVAYNDPAAADVSKMLDENAAKIARFRSLLHTPSEIANTYLGVEVEGSGTITHSRSDDYSCTDSCMTKVFPSSFDVIATPNPGWRFSGWSGACSGTSSKCRVSALLATNVVAKFELGSIALEKSGKECCDERTTEIVASPNGSVWFADWGENKIGRFADKKFTFWDVPTSGGITSNTRLAVGSDNAIWFTEPDTNKIGRIDNTGSITEYPLPDDNSGPRDLTLGPDGAMWFTEIETHKIGRITVDGTITELPLVGAFYPQAIAYGNDGNFWVSTLTNDVLRVQTAPNGEGEAVYDKFSVPETSSNLVDMTPGPDGAIWFAAGNSKTIGKITPDGTFTDYESPNISPRVITSGPDGNLWFSGSGASAIGRITTDGVISEFATDFPNPWGIAQGYGGSMWLVDYFEGPGKVVVSPQDVRVGSLYPSSRADTQSFLRFYNNDIAAGSVSISVSDPQNGQLLGQWNSPSISPGTGPQFSIESIESSILNAQLEASSTLTATIRSTFAGSFQHVLWSKQSGALTNLSTCIPSEAHGARRLANVHSTLLDDQYPSSVVVSNTGFIAASVDLGIYNAASGIKIGTYTTKVIPSNGMKILKVTDIENSAQLPPPVDSSDFHYVIKIESPFTGFLQHVVSNTRSGVITDMTTTCRLNSGARFSTPLSNMSLTDYALPAGPEVSVGAFAEGLDGSMWYTKSSTANRVGRISNDGQILAEYFIPTFVSAPRDIAVGPDGNMWFTEGGKNKIGFINATNGAIQEFVLPTAGSGPTGIAKGPDDAMWFALLAANKIGRITKEGTITEYSPSTGSLSEPYGIASDGSGALWFTQRSGNKIGRIQVSTGVITEFPLPKQNSKPEVIRLGPDGAMWFTLRNGRKIGRISSAGEISEFSINKIYPKTLAVGPDNALWFTGDYYEGGVPKEKMGRLTVEGDLSVYDVNEGVSALGSSSTNKTLWLGYDKGAEVARFVPMLEGLNSGFLFSTAPPDLRGSRSFLRFDNTSNTAGTVTVNLAASETGQIIGSWTSANIPSGATLQTSIEEMEAGINPSLVSGYYSAQVQASFKGDLQHVLWRSTDGSLTNLSTCLKQL